MTEAELTGLSLTVQWLLGGVIVVLYAKDRFNDPLRIRATTTFERYWLAWFGYIVAMLGIFVLLGGGLTEVNAVALLKMIGAGDVDTNAVPPGPLLSALLLTSLLPHIPVLQRIDITVKSWFQRVGNVPHEVRELSLRLRKSTYEPRGEELNSVLRDMRSKQFNVAWLSVPADSFKHRWAVIALLCTQVEGWRSSRIYGNYVSENQAALGEIRSRVDALDEFLDEGALAELDGDSAARFTVHMRKQTARELEAIGRLLFDFVASGILSGGRTPAQRHLAIEHLGFKGLPSVPDNLSAHDLVLVSGLVFIAMLFVPLMIRRFFVDAPLDYQIRIIVMVPIIYAVSIVLAIYPKSAWTYAMRHPGQPRPFAAYAVSGVLAAIASFFISLLFRFAFDTPGNVLHALATPGAFSKAWTSTVERWPWLLMTFFVTISIAWAADDKEDEAPASRLWLRLVEAAALAAIFGALAWMVVQLLAAGLAPDKAAHLLDAEGRMIGTSVIVGAIIGAFVPSLYRRRSRKDVGKVLSPASDAAMNGSMARVTTGAP